MLPDRQERSRARPLPGPHLQGLVRPHHPGPARRRLPRHHPRPRTPGRSGRKRGSPISSGGDHTSDGDELIPLTANEIRRLLAHLVLAPTHGPDRRLRCTGGAQGEVAAAPPGPAGGRATAVRHCAGEAVLATLAYRLGLVVAAG